MREAPIRQVVRQPHALRDFGIRTLTAVAQGVILVVADLSGTVWWALAVAAVSVMCTIEFYALMRTEHRKPNEVFGVIAAGAMPIAAALYATHVLPASGASTQSQLGAMGLTFVVAGLILAAVLWHTVFKQVSASDTSTTVFGVVYCGFTLSHLVLLRALDSGAELVLITIASVWCMDVFAYLVGSAVGTHRLAPEISPKKSWEGFIAGALFSTIAWGVGWSVVRPPQPLWLYLAIGALLAAAGLLGDLAESRLKREVGAKDSGRWLPGHGGFLDRFDSMIIVAIVVYYVLVLGGAR